MFRFTQIVEDTNGREYELPATQALAQRDPVLTVSLRPLEEQNRAMIERGETVPTAVEGLALVDTGASRTCVDKDAASRAGLNEIDRASISSASHSAHGVPVFACEIEFASLGKIRLPLC